MSSVSIQRLPKRERSCQVPRPLGNGMFEVDGTWGTVQPLRLAPGVRTVAECEVIDHLDRGLPIVDTRLEHFHREGTIPGALGVPDAVRALLDHGYPPPAILYYRGGIHDWMTLGYPVVAGADATASG